MALQAVGSTWGIKRVLAGFWAGAVTVGRTGDSYDDALAETVIGLFKTEEIHRRGPWKGLEDVEFATLEWVAWYNGSRLLEPLGYVPPAEFEQAYHDRQTAPAGMAVLT